MARPLEGTVALITGASSGIGETTARVLAAEGAAVALLARRADRLRALADKLSATGAKTLTLEADVTDRLQVEAVVKRTVTGLGRLDILVNNAGVISIGPATEAKLEEWDRMLAVNLAGLLYVTRVALPHLINAAQDSPRQVADIVTISSTAGCTARAGQAVYSLTKFGGNAFAESLRQELQSQHVRVGVVEPGTVNTELASHLPEDVRKAFERQTKGMELLRPQDIADAVSYMVTRDRRVAVNEMLVRAADQTW